MRKSKYTREVLAPIVAESSSVTDVIRRLGLEPTGGNWRYIRGRLRHLELDTSHFRGSAWSRGETRETHPSIERQARTLMRPDDNVFIENASPLNGASIVKRLLRAGLPYLCALCGINEWRGARLTLHLDHLNGINNDNRRENLRLLCPNCHSQTDTYGRQPSHASEAVLYDNVSRAWRNWLTQRL